MQSLERATTTVIRSRIPHRPFARCGSLLSAALALLLCSASVSAQLMVHPTRIVLDKNQRSAQLEIINNSDEPGIYRIALVNRRMDENGVFSAVETPIAGEQFADGMLRYSPRRVVIAPGASQLIRLMVRRPADLAAGEYRSHLLFDKQPNPGARPAPATVVAGGEIGVSLTSLVGVSIPVIVRQGETSATVSLGNLALTPAATGQPAVLSLDMRRSGNQSVYGDLTVSFAPTGGAAQVVGRAGGVAVYTPNMLRRVKLKLEPPAGLMLTNGTLSVTYREPSARGGGLLAEASLSLR